MARGLGGTTTHTSGQVRQSGPPCPERQTHHNSDFVIRITNQNLAVIYLPNKFEKVAMIPVGFKMLLCYTEKTLIPAKGTEGSML